RREPLLEALRRDADVPPGPAVDDDRRGCGRAGSVTPGTHDGRASVRLGAHDLHPLRPQHLRHLTREGGEHLRRRRGPHGRDSKLASRAERATYARLTPEATRYPARMAVTSSTASPGASPTRASRCAGGTSSMRPATAAYSPAAQVARCACLRSA